MGIDTQWRLRFGDVLRATGTDAEEVLVLRHTYRPDGLQAPTNPERVLAYTRSQYIEPRKFPAIPPRWWCVFMAEPGLRSRLECVYENHGEVAAERTATNRFFDLRPSDLLSSMWGRLVIEWSRDPVNWAKSGPRAATFPVVEVADAQLEEFPGYDQLVISFAQLQQVVTSPRYVKWQAALEAVQGIYLIADTATGQLYVGKADGGERIWGRWTTYARTGHGGNLRMRELADLDPDQPHRYQFSLLQVFGPEVPRSRIDLAEAHYKQALQTRRFGLNRN